MLRFGQLVPPTTTTSKEGGWKKLGGTQLQLSAALARLPSPAPRVYYRKFPHSLDFRVPERFNILRQTSFQPSPPPHQLRMCRRGHSRDTMKYFSLSANDVIRSNRKTMLCRNNSMLFFFPSPFVATFSPGWTTDGNVGKKRRVGRRSNK